jgi:hypothetical protein
VEHLAADDGLPGTGVLDECRLADTWFALDQDSRATPGAYRRYSIYEPEQFLITPEKMTKAHCHQERLLHHIQVNNRLIRDNLSASNIRFVVEMY